MGIIKAAKLAFDYLRYEEEGEEPEVNRAIDHVDLDIEEGKFIAILGHNGSGKSTLAKHINGLLVPTEGTLWVDHMNTASDADIWNIRQKAGMVFQNPDNQIIGTVVEEDVGFGPENLGVPTEDIWKRVDESLKAVGWCRKTAHLFAVRNRSVPADLPVSSAGYPRRPPGHFLWSHQRNAESDSPEYFYHFRYFR